MRKSLAIAALTIVVGCVPAAIPPSPVRSGTTVHTSFGKTWNAVIDEFSTQNIPIKTIDRSSGIIVTEQLQARIDGVAECGSSMGGKLFPTHANYNVLVRGDSNSTVVRVTPRWVRTGMSRVFMDTSIVTEECASTGMWETEFERKIREAAEKK